MQGYSVSLLYHVRVFCVCFIALVHMQFCSVFGRGTVSDYLVSSHSCLFDVLMITFIRLMVPCTVHVETAF